MGERRKPRRETMQMNIWVLSTCSEGVPCFPQVFTCQEDGDKALLDVLREEWAADEPENDTGPVEFPEDAGIAMDKLAKLDPTYEPWELTCHAIEATPAAPLALVCDLSTAHVTYETGQKLDDGAIGSTMKGDHGWLVHVASEPTEQPDAPADLLVCVRYARQLGAQWILFDRDAAAIDALPSYEW